jgi:GNAT superfamily N-acetyltransferase
LCFLCLLVAGSFAFGVICVICGLFFPPPPSYHCRLMDPNETAFALPRGGQMALRPVTDADEEFLLSIYAGTRADELAQAPWEPGQQEAFVKWQFDLQRREYGVRFPDAEYYVIVIDDCPAGRIWIGRDDRQIRLLDIAILPEFQNRGSGTLLLRWLIDESKRAGKALRHMVFVLNPDAHRFYERLGFVVIEEFGAYKHMEWRENDE